MPGTEDADPRLDFSTRALLVPVNRWNDHAHLEPNLSQALPRQDRAGARRDPAGDVYRVERQALAR